MPSSLIIDDLLSGPASPRSPVAFFYFDHQDQESQTPLMVMSCILRQILERLPELPQTVTRLHGSREASGPPSELQCGSIIAECAKSSTITYIIIDALDECDGTRHLKAVLQLITELKEILSCRILVTSRPHIHDLTAIFQPYPQIRIEAHVEDLHNYLRQELTASSIWDIADRPFVEQIILRLTRGAEGM